MKKQLLLLACSTLAMVSSAQVSNYSFVQGTGSYGATQSGSIVGLDVQDDDVNYVNLPFNFPFNGTSYNTVNVCANGYLGFYAPTGAEYVPLDDTISQVMAPFGTDLLSVLVVTGDISSGSNTITNVSNTSILQVGDSLYDVFGDYSTMYPIVTQISGSSVVLNANAITTASGYDVYFPVGRIYHNTTGTTPNRVTTFEYRRFARWFTYDESISFKVRLHETSGKIEYVYNAATPGFGSDPQVGLRGYSSSSTDFNARYVDFSNSWATSTQATQTYDQCLFTSGQAPGNGLTYTWSPCSIPNFTASASSSTVCAGNSITLTASGATTYSWVNIGAAASVTVSPTANTNYTVIVSASGCSSQGVVSVSVSPAPTVNATQSLAHTCAGQTVTLNASGANTYSWTGLGTGAQITVTPGVTTNYTVTGSNGTCAAVQHLTHSVTAMPTLSVAHSKTVSCKGETVSLTGSGAVTYSWSTGGNGASISISPTTTTSYTLTGFDGPCTVTTLATQNVINCMDGIFENAISQSTEVYPVPFNNLLTVKNNFSGIVTATIMDITGKTIETVGIEGGHQETLNAGPWAPGIYLIKISSGDQSYVRKLIKD